MKIKVGLVASSYGDNPAVVDLDVSLDLTATERNKLQLHDIPIPGIDGRTTYNICKKCWATHGDLFREVGIRNYTAYRPDVDQFRTGNNGWRAFITHLVMQDDREDVLRRIGIIIGRKLGLLTGKMPTVVVNGRDVIRPAATTVQLTDVEGETVDIRIGNRLYRATSIEENAVDNTLLDKVKSDLETNANLQVSGFESEFASNITMMDKQCKSEVTRVNRLLASRLPALTIPEHLLREGMIVSRQGIEYRVYIPIQLHYKYIATQNYMWELAKKYQLKQKGYLMIALGINFTNRWTWIYDRKFRNRVQLFHTAGDTLCLGDYSVHAKTLEDIPKIRDDIATMYEKINTTSIMSVNLDGKMLEVYEAIRTDVISDFDLDGEEACDIDLSDVAVLIKDKEEAVWTT